MKKIAITQRLTKYETYNETRDTLDVNWTRLFNALDFLPIIIPSHYDIEKYFEMGIDGIILSGGNDLAIFSEDPNSKKRDSLEKQALQVAVQHNIPVLGVCRGMQLIAHIYGGDLKKAEGHVGHHKITVNKSSTFNRELGKIKEVNSYHNYVVASVPPGFISSAQSSDGYCEAMENEKLRIFAQMWHPERNTPFSQGDLELIKKVFK
jgi:gamma-glutamyl-gamma-aminobutyrate hydrolase PuuD